MLQLRRERLAGSREWAAMRQKHIAGLEPIVYPYALSSLYWTDTHRVMKDVVWIVRLLHFL
jgi:hypothetical protein